MVIIELVARACEGATIATNARVEGSLQYGAGAPYVLLQVQNIVKSRKRNQENIIDSIRPVV